jgi:hypothetical protein
VECGVLSDHELRCAGWCRHWFGWIMGGGGLWDVGARLVGSWEEVSCVFVGTGWSNHVKDDGMP